MTESPAYATGVAPLFCARCALELQPGRGGFFEVTIEAAADPYPPILDDDVDPAALRAGIEQALRELDGLSAQEAMDQVHRRLVLQLCDGCFGSWIENPTGS